MDISTTPTSHTKTFLTLLDSVVPSIADPYSQESTALNTLIELLKCDGMLEFEETEVCLQEFMCTHLALFLCDSCRRDVYVFSMSPSSEFAVWV